MNDFTKEELIILQQAYNGACKAFSNDDTSLEGKINSMIKNYHTHTFLCGCCNENVMQHIGHKEVYKCLICEEFYNFEVIQHE